MKKYWLLLLSSLFFEAQSQTRDSLDIKIGQMILIGMPAPAVDSLVLQEVKAGKVGSLIYFEKNIPKSTSAFAAFKKMSWTYQKAAPIPLFICIDQEGGKVNRLKEKYGFTRSITAGAIGKFKSIDSVQFYAEATAATLAGLGINVNFAPCVDLLINPNNPAIAKSERSYSYNEDTVIMYAREVIKQHRKFGVITALKHFPGHGSSKDDTHLGLTDVTNTWSARELKPYKVLINEGYADGVMTSHIVNKNLDHKAFPGTLSISILDSILRKKIGFNGVVFSDDMQMKAIANNYGLEEAIRLAVNAGVDIMCFSNNILGVENRAVDRVHDIIKNYVASGEIKKSRIDESFKRIMKLKKQISPDWEVQSLRTQNQKLIKQNSEETTALAKANEEIDQLKGKKKKKKSKAKK
ncbi:MAG TPA: glycoside hydrolase family 3 N-terminal domain-containing protein [Cyclobacteriaceae bacterium]|jgi:beta-N-acetylhexosaminidase|nr:glycoside hydrolase family 3 N-terminal domain-containing protein [Cyclobacteriaceae bacterium]